MKLTLKVLFIHKIQVILIHIWSNKKSPCQDNKLCFIYKTKRRTDILSPILTIIVVHENDIFSFMILNETIFC